MGSTVRSLSPKLGSESLVAAAIRWRDWPLGNHLRWSWIVLLGMGAVGTLVWWLGQSWPLAIVAIAALALSAWQFLVPISYEIGTLGIVRNALGRTWLVPWSAIRAYQMRSTGVLFFQQADPHAADLLNSLFVPYPNDEDEMVVAVRLYLTHAVELS